MVIKRGTVFKDRYHINHLLATGGIGFIYHGQDLLLKNNVVVKQQQAPTPQFKKEAILLARLRHPALPRVIDYFENEGDGFLVMDYIEGKSLGDILKSQQQPLSELMALDYLLQICEAIEYIHQQDPIVLHRDIKPDNVIITPDNQAVLVDFGIAKEGDNPTRAMARCVTHGYSRPEQYGPGTTRLSDIYALGATLYTLLTNQRPPRSTYLIRDEYKLTPPHEIQPFLNKKTSKLTLQAMALLPEERPQSVGEWQQQLEKLFQRLERETNIDEDDPTWISPSKGSRSTHYWFVNAESDEGYRVLPTELVIGRSVNSDILVVDSAVSRQHARIQTNGQYCFILDESSNGTFVNDERIGQRWHRLSVGDKILLGNVEFTISTIAPKRVLNPHATSTGPKPDLKDFVTKTK